MTIIRFDTENQFLQLAQVLSGRNLITFRHDSSKVPQKTTKTYNLANQTRYLKTLGPIRYLDIDIEGHQLSLSDGRVFGKDIFFKYL